MADNVLTESEQVSILKALHEWTDQGKREWQRDDTPVRPDRRILIAPDKSFRFVLQSADRDGERPYQLIVSINRGNDLYRTFTVIEMRAADEGGNATINDLIEDLYIKAHKRQPSEEAIVKSLFDTLKLPDDKPEGSQS